MDEIVILQILDQNPDLAVVAEIMIAGVYILAGAAFAIDAIVKRSKR